MTILEFIRSNGKLNFPELENKFAGDGEGWIWDSLHDRWKRLLTEKEAIWLDKYFPYPHRDYKRLPLGIGVGIDKDGTWWLIKPSL